jgi:DNA damage-binding protein 1
VLDLGLISPPSSLTPLSPNHIFITSAAGDHQLVRLQPGSSSKMQPKRDAEPEVEQVQGSLEVIERWMNLAPVKDFTVVSDESGAVVS